MGLIQFLDGHFPRWNNFVWGFKCFIRVGGGGGGGGHYLYVCPSPIFYYPSTYVQVSNTVFVRLGLGTKNLLITHADGQRVNVKQILTTRLKTPIKHLSIFYGGNQNMTNIGPVMVRKVTPKIMLSFQINIYCTIKSYASIFHDLLTKALIKHRLGLRRFGPDNIRLVSS